MTISEFSKIAAALKTVYTAPGFVPNEQALDMWYRLVGKNNDYQTISVAAQMYMTKLQSGVRSTKGDRQVPAEAPRDDKSGGSDRAERNGARTTHTGRNSWAVRAG